MRAHTRPLCKCEAANLRLALIPSLFARCESHSLNGRRAPERRRLGLVATNRFATLLRPSSSSGVVTKTLHTPALRRIRQGAPGIVFAVTATAAVTTTDGVPTAVSEPRDVRRRRRCLHRGGRQSTRDGGHRSSLVHITRWLQRKAFLPRLSLLLEQLQQGDPSPSVADLHRGEVEAGRPLKAQRICMVAQDVAFPQRHDAVRREQRARVLHSSRTAEQRHTDDARLEVVHRRQQNPVEHPGNETYGGRRVSGADGGTHRPRAEAAAGTWPGPTQPRAHALKGAPRHARVARAASAYFSLSHHVQRGP